MKKHKYLFVACLSLFPVMAVAGNDTLHEIMEVTSARTGSTKGKWWTTGRPSLW
mgnify:CR=1 FL=1